MEKKCRVIIRKIEEEIRVIHETKTEVTSAKDKLASAGNNISQIFVTTKMGQIVAMDTEQCLKKGGVESEEGITFIPDQKLLEMFNRLKVLEQSMLDDKVIVKQKGSLFQTKGMEKYPIKVKSDSKDCGIFSSCVLEDGTIILADHNNKKLKRLDRSTYSVRDHYNLAKKPWKVCDINNQEVAVSYQKQEIMFISLGKKMTQKSLIKTDFECHGLAYADDNLYISDYNTSVYIYSVSGSKLKQISMDQSGQSLFSGFWGISSLAVSEDGSKIYVADSEEGLMVLDNNGKAAGKYNGRKIDFAFDDHLTSSGDVLVFGVNTNNVLQFGPGGELIGEVVKSSRGNEGCQTVCCNQQMSKMIIGGQKNEIEVYELV